MKTEKTVQRWFVFIIIAINIYAFFLCDPFHQNISDIGNALHHRGYMILWASSIAIYLYFYTKQLIKKMKVESKMETFFLALCCLGMVASILIPYDPQHHHMLANIHIYASIASTAGYAIVFMHFLSKMFHQNILFFQDAFPKYIIIVLFDCLYYLLNGVTTLLEASFCIYMSIFLYYLLHKD